MAENEVGRMLEYSIVFYRHHNDKEAAIMPNRVIAEIFVVPVCSILSHTPHAYLDFLQKAGALDRAAEVIAAANVDRADSESAETVRREVRAILTAAEVEVLTPPIPQLSW
jgi:hypothetical protein